MLKKILYPFLILILNAVPLNGQAVHVNISYQSFRPFVHFQLNFGNDRYHNRYRSTYLKGYMDGVNKQYYYSHRFEEMVENRRIYKKGYRDGMKDRAMLAQLRGRRWLRHHRFKNEDYYEPYASVRIWLKNMTLAFVKAPERRLPPGWRRKIDPRARRYRSRFWHRHHRNRRRHRRKYDDDYEERYEEYYEELEERYEEYNEEYEERLEEYYEEREEEYDD